MHRDLLKSMILSLFSVCKLSGNPLERKSSVGDRPKRQTVFMVFPSLAMALGFGEVSQKCCEIWVWICLSPFVLTTLPSVPKVPCLMSSMGLTWASMRAEGLCLGG